MLPQTGDVVTEDPAILADAEVLFSGWSGPMLDYGFSRQLQDLKAIFYGAASADLTPAVWERGIVVTSALEANAVPVAEYTLSTILFSSSTGGDWPGRQETHRNDRRP